MSEPVPVKELPPETLHLLLELFKGTPAGFCSVGSEEYVMPRSYARHAGAVKNMRTRSDDVWLLTFPRSGTTMVAEMLWLLNNDLDYDKAKQEHLSQRRIFIESYFFHNEHYKLPEDGDLLSDYPPPRTIATHLPLSLLPSNLLNSSKVLYIARDPRDVVVSYYHFSKSFRFVDYKGDFKQFWKLFREDLVPYAPFFPRLKEAWAHKDHPNMLFMFYEDIVKDIPAAVSRVAKFCGKEYSDEQLKTLSKHLDINIFRKNKSVVPLFCQDPRVHNPNTEPFVRKGVAGGWNEYFDEDMKLAAEDWMKEQLAGTDLQFLNSE